MEEEKNEDLKFAELKNGFKITLPLKIVFEPKEDITTYELAMCLPYFFTNSVMPWMIDQSLPHFRHFKITDPNKNK